MTNVISDALKVKVKFIIFYYMIIIVSGFVASVLLAPFDLNDSGSPIELLIVSLVVCSLLIYSFSLYSEQNNITNKLRYLCLNKITLATTSLIVLGTICIKTLEYLLVDFLDIPTDTFLLNLSVFFESQGNTILLFVTICIVVPIYEELLFRGWLVSKLRELKINSALIISLNGSLFAIFHSQYNHFFSYLFLLTLGCFVCWLRIKTSNVTYSIISHCTFNTIAFCALYYASIRH